MAAADIITINVKPRSKEITSQIRCPARCLRLLKPTHQERAVVIVESTVAPGTTRNVVIPEIEKSAGLVLNNDYFLGVCPERVMPGKLLDNLINMSRVCGGSTPETAQVMKALYETFVKGDIDTCDIITAEIVKTAENTYRDVQIAFANEVALICEEYGADVYEVRGLVNKSPNRSMHLPGAGVGGHCIPKDPWLLVAGMPDDKPTQLIPAARKVNASMPGHLVDRLGKMLNKHDKMINGAKILVLGLAYLEDSDDTRNSPSEVLITHLNSLGAEVVVHDPFVDGYRNGLMELAADCDAVVLMVAHSAYKEIDLSTLHTKMKTPVFLDGRHVMDKEKMNQAGFDYYCVGVGNK